MVTAGDSRNRGVALKAHAVFWLIGFWECVLNLYSRNKCLEIVQMHKDGFIVANIGKGGCGFL